jgi:E3 ubiquitin-protein ligase RGLG
LQLENADGELNPYQQVISIVGRTLEGFDQDKHIPVFGFGDQQTTYKRVFPFNADGKPCHGFHQVLERYNALTPTTLLSGPTSFAPVIRKAIEIVKMSDNSYHILVIISDGDGMSIYPAPSPKARRCIDALVLHGHDQ